MTDPKDPKDPKDTKDETKGSKVPSVDKSKQTASSTDAKKEEAKKAPLKKTDPKESAKAKTDPKKAPSTAAASKADPKKTGSTTTTQPKAQVTAKKKGSWKLKAAGFLILVAAGGGAGAYYTQDIWVPQVKKKTVEMFGLETVMEPAAPQIDPAIITELQNRLAAVESREIPTFEAPKPVDLTPLVNQINELENNVSSIKISSGDTESLEKIEKMVAKVEGLELPDFAAMNPDLSGLEAENAALKNVVEALASRIQALEEDKQLQRNATDTAQALVAALSTLRQAMMHSQGFASELAVMKTLADADGEMMVLVEKLAPYADQGVKSFSALLTTYDRMAADVIRAGAIPEGADWMEETVKNLTTLVTIRSAPGDIEGDGPIGIVARAEHNLSNGDLAQALAELALLQGKPKEAAQNWMAQAQARLLAQDTLAALQARVLARINGA